MPEPKKAPAQSSISSFFRPKHETDKTDVFGDQEDETGSAFEGVIDLTAAGSSSLEPVLCCTNEVETGISPPRPAVPAQKHSFFRRFDDKIQKQKKLEDINDARLVFVRQCRQVLQAKPPLFPPFIGTASRATQYQSVCSYTLKEKREFNMSQWSQLPINVGSDEQPQGVFEDRVELYRTSGVEQVYQSILGRVHGKKIGPGRRWVFHDEEDSDDWLPTGFRDLSAFGKPKNDIASHVHLVVGPTGTGKSYLATRLAAELQAPLTTLSVVGPGPKGERTGRQFEDLLTSAEHRDLLNCSAEGIHVVLVDEIDLVFEGDRGFVAGLASYLANVPPRHVVIMTSNAPVSVLARYYSFTRDICVHEPQGKREIGLSEDRPSDLASLELASQEDWIQSQMASFELIYEGSTSLVTCVDDWQGPDRPSNAFYTTSHRLFTSYSRSITRQKCRPPAPTLIDWHTEYLPTWYRLEAIHGALEEERALLKRRRQATRYPSGFRFSSYFRFSQEITSQVLSLYSLD